MTSQGGNLWKEEHMVKQEAREIPDSRTVNYCGGSQVLESTTLESSEGNVLNDTTTLHKVLPLTTAVRTKL